MLLFCKRNLKQDLTVVLHNLMVTLRVTKILLHFWCNNDWKPTKEDIAPAIVGVYGAKMGRGPPSLEVIGNILTQGYPQTLSSAVNVIKIRVTFSKIYYIFITFYGPKKQPTLNTKQVCKCLTCASLINMNE